ncbi:unnamed protein product [Effrenium voratum]|nr:unnamed protein product [Effrenium voratum]
MGEAVVLWQNALCRLNEARCEAQVKSHGACIAACGAAAWRCAAAVFAALPKRSLRQNVVTYNSTAAACEKAWRRSAEVLAALRRAALQQTEISQTAAVRACEKGTQWRRAVGVLQGNCGLRGNVITYSAGISACEKSGCWSCAMELLTQLRRKEIELHGITLNSALSACGRAAAWRSGLGLYSDDDLDVDVVRCNAACSACGNARRWRQALQLLLLCTSGRSPTVVTCNSAISSCEKVGRWREALAIFETMHPEASRVTCNSLISACASAGRWQSALALFVLTARRFRADSVGFNALARACERGGVWQVALAVLEAAKERRMEDVITYNSSISACVSAAQWQHALGLLQEAKTCRLADVITYGAPMPVVPWPSALWLLEEIYFQLLEVDAVAQLGAVAAASSWPRALRLGLGLRRAQEPSVATWNSLLASPWRSACALLGAMARSFLRRSGVTRSAALAALAAEAPWRQALRLGAGEGDVLAAGFLLTALERGGSAAAAPRLLGQMERRKVGSEVEPWTMLGMRDPLVLERTEERRATLPGPQARRRARRRAGRKARSAAGDAEALGGRGRPRWWRGRRDSDPSNVLEDAAMEARSDAWADAHWQSWRDLLEAALAKVTHWGAQSSFGYAAALLAWHSVGLAVGNSLAGALFQQVSAKALLLLSLSLTLLCAVGLGFQETPGLLSTAVLRFGSGVAAALPLVYLPLWVDEFSPAETHGQWMSIVQTGVPLGQFFGVLAAAGATAAENGWRWALLAQGAMLLPVILRVATVPSAQVDVANLTLTARLDSISLHSPEGVQLWRLQSLLRELREMLQGMNRNPLTMSLSSTLCLLHATGAGLALWAAPRGCLCYSPRSCSPAYRPLARTWGPSPAIAWRASRRACMPRRCAWPAASRRWRRCAAH